MTKKRKLDQKYHYRVIQNNIKTEKRKECEGATEQKKKERNQEEKTTKEQEDIPPPPTME